MAGTVADIDNNIPDLGKYRTTEEKLSAIQDYLFLLLETLKYKLRNLTPDENFNTTEVTRWMNETVVNIGVNPELLAQIAALVEGNMPGSRIVAREILENPKSLKGIPLTPSQTARIDRFLTLHPDFQYADSVRLIRERGCWYEQESFRC